MGRSVPNSGPYYRSYLVRFLFLVLSLLSTQVFAQTTTYINAQNQYFEEAQATTRTAPTTSPVATTPSATKPLMLNRWTSYRLTVCPPLGYALDGTGSVRLYVFNHRVMTTGRWGYNPALDQLINISGSVVDRCFTKGFQVDVRQGFLMPVTIGVGLTGGSLVTVRVDPDNYITN
jgi:hypothetical protein